MTHEDVMEVLRKMPDSTAAQLSAELGRGSDRGQVTAVFGYLKLLESRGRVSRFIEKKTWYWRAV